MNRLYGMTLWLLSPQLSGTKKEKDGEDKKRNPILKYIGKPRTTSQSSKYTHSCTDSVGALAHHIRGTLTQTCDALTRRVCQTILISFCPLFALLLFFAGLFIDLWNFHCVLRL